MPVIIVDYSGPIATEDIIGAIRKAAPGAALSLAQPFPEPEADWEVLGKQNQDSYAASLLQQDAEAVADIIAPRKDDTARIRFLRGIAFNLNSLEIAQGDPFWNPRGSAGAIGRLLRRKYPDDKSPLDRLFKRFPIYDQSGEYIAVRYVATDLGQRVLECLFERGALPEWQPDRAFLKAARSIADKIISERPVTNTSR